MLSRFDVEHIHEIMANVRHDWFSAQLLRLVNKTSGLTKARLRSAFPAHVELVDWWAEHGADDPAPLHLIERF